MSPYNLLQEIYREDPWKMMVCCILLNRTNGKHQVHPMIRGLFDRYPTPERMSRARQSKLAEMIRSLGLYNIRSRSLIEMSKQWVAGQAVEPKKMRGIGKYAMDSYNIFVNNRLSVKTEDKQLTKYLRWARAEKRKHNDKQRKKIREKAGVI